MFFFFWKAENIYILLKGKPVPVVPKIKITKHQGAILQENHQQKQKTTRPKPN